MAVYLIFRLAAPVQLTGYYNLVTVYPERPVTVIYSQLPRVSGALSARCHKDY